LKDLLMVAIAHPVEDTGTHSVAGYDSAPAMCFSKTFYEVESEVNLR
jgi:hypothetical protein